MKSELEFPDAAAFVFMDGMKDGSWSGYTVVIAVEDSLRVQYRTPGSKTLALPQSWRKLKTAVEKDFQTASTVVYARFQLARSEASRELAAQLGADAERFIEVWEMVESVEKTGDQSLALEVLAKDASWSSRFRRNIGSWVRS